MVLFISTVGYSGRILAYVCEYLYKNYTLFFRLHSQPTFVVRLRPIPYRNHCKQSCHIFSDIYVNGMRQMSLFCGDSKLNADMDGIRNADHH